MRAGRKDRCGCAFALMGGTCRVQGVGDFLKALPPVPECWFTVVIRDYGVSTPEAFAAYDRWAAAFTRTAERRKPLSVPEIWMPFVPPPAMRWKSAAEQRIPGPSRPCCGSMALSPPDDRQRCGGVRHIPGRRGRTGCCTGRKAALEAGVRGAA